MTTPELTVEQALAELREMLPDIDGLQVSAHAWFWKERGRIQQSAKILLGVIYDAPKFSAEGEDSLRAVMVLVRQWKAQRTKEHPQ